MSRNARCAGKPYPEALRAFVAEKHKDHWSPASIAAEVTRLWPDFPMSRHSVCLLTAAQVIEGKQSATKTEPFKLKRRTYDTCVKLSYRDGDVYECGAPSFGKPHCEACARHLMTYVDRATPAPTSIKAAKAHPWHEGQRTTPSLTNMTQSRAKAAA